MPRNNHQKKPAGQRQLRVGEEIRHALSTIFMRGECHDPDLLGISITVSEVRISPDLKNATAYVMPLNGNQSEKTLTALKRLSPYLRNMVGSRMKLRYTPRLGFELDNTFDEATRIHLLLNNPKVRSDIEQADEDQGLPSNQ
jgi:ribosome-binding factor A